MRLQRRERHAVETAPPRRDSALAWGCSHTVENACTGEGFRYGWKKASEEQSPCKDTPLAGAE